MNKKYKKQLILTVGITLLPILAGLLLWDQLPERIAVHFDFAGKADNYMGKTMALLLLPALLAALQALSVTITLNDPKRRNIGSRMMTVFFWLIPILSWLIYGLMLFYALGMKADVVLITHIFVGLIFIVLGNYMTKVQQNYTVGVRVPWTLASKENWRRTHRMAAKIWIIAGILILFDGFLKSSWLLFLAVGAAVLLPILYSFILYKRGVE